MTKYVYPPGSRVGGRSGKYPIDTVKRARAALSYSARKDTAGSYSTVAKAVRKKYGAKVASTSKSKGVVYRAGGRKRRSK